MSSVACYAKRALRLMAAMCVFLLFSSVAIAEELLICSECGREGEAGQSACSSCGAHFAPSKAPVEADAPKKALSSSATDVMKAASADVAEARRVASENGALAIILYRNAQALLAAESGEDFEAKAARMLADELKRTRDGFYESVAPSRRSAALRKARREAEDYFRSVGRTPFGSVWVPLDWPQSLMPASLAAIRHAMQPRCVKCEGAGVDPCNKCGGAGRVKCRGPKCKNGFVERRNPNSLTPKTDLVIRDKCPVCKGTARDLCVDCAGKGVRPCKKCDGSGEAPMCKDCQGTGLEACRICTKNPPKEDCVFCKGSLRALCRKCGGDGKTIK